MAATVGPNSQNTFDKFTPTFTDVDGDNPITLKISTLPSVGKFESNTDGDNNWTAITSVPFEVAMNDLSKYRFNAGDNSGQNTDVNWSVMTSRDNTYGNGLWSNTATGVVTIIDPNSNNAPDTNLSVGNLVTIDEDGKTNPIYITFSDDYTPSKFLVGVIDSNDTSKVSQSDFNVTRISDNNVSVVITPKANVYGDVNITLGAFDGDKNGTKSFTLHINPINDIPTAQDFEKTINEDNNYSFSTLNPITVYTDTNDSTQDTNESYPEIFNIITLPSHGTLHLGDNTTLVADTNVSLANLSSLVYTPELNNNTDVNFTWKASDGEAWTGIKTATFNINAIDDAPTLNTITNLTQLEDANDLNITLVANDIEGNDITYDVSSSNSSIATAIVDVNGNLIITQKNNANGVVSFEVNATANSKTVTKNFDLNITAVDDKPTFTTSITNPNVQDEDFTDFNITLTSNDTEDDNVTYHATSSDTAKVKIDVVRNILVISSVLNEYGTVRVDYNVTQDSNNSLFDTGFFNFTVNSVNDKPTFVTTLSDLTINEDNGTTNYDINVTDIEGDELNVTVESNNTNILTISPSWNGLLKLADYTNINKPLDFNLTTVKDANGMVKITIITKDDGDLNSTQTFDINVSAVNDKPILSTIPTQTKDEDFTTYSLDLNGTDVDDSNLTYTAISNNTDLVTVDVIDNNLTFTSVANANGTTTIDVNVTDGKLTDSKTFTINVSSQNDTPIINVDTNLSTSEDNNNSLVYTLSDIEDTNLTLNVESNASNGTVSIVNDKVFYIPNVNYNGTDSFTVSLTDSNGKKILKTINVDITAVDDAPILTTVTNPTTKDEDFNDFSIALASTDIEDNNVSYKATSNDVVDVSVNNNILTIKSIANKYGNASVDINVSQDSNTSLFDTQTISFTVNSVNDKPTFVTTLSDLTINEDNGTTNYDINVTDIEGDELNVTVESNNTNILTISPSWNGLLKLADYTNINKPLDFNLTTVKDANGMVKITIITKDDGDLNSTQTFDINVSAVNDKPILSTIPTQTKDEDFTTYSLDLNGTDVDDSNLTYTAISNNTDLVTVDVIDNNLTFTSVANANGTTTIDVNVTDGKLTDSKTFTINVSSQNDTPIINVDTNLSTSEDNNNSLVYTLSDIEDTNLTLNVESNASNGTVSIVNDKVFYIPNVNYNGTDSFTVSLTDSNGKKILKTINVNISAVDDAPSFGTTLSDLTINEDNGTTNYDINVTDIEGDELNVTVESNNTNILTISPSWNGLLKLADYTNINKPLDFNLTTVKDANGMVKITIITKDDGDLNSTQTFDINVSTVNDKPILSTIPTQTKNEDFTTYSLDLNGIDVDDSNLTYTAISNNTDLVTVDVIDNNLTFTSVANANGTTTIDVNVTDGKLTDSKTFTINVSSQNDTPIINVDTNLSTSEDNNNSLVYTLSDIEDTNLTLNVESNASNGTVSIVNDKVFYIPNVNYNGTDSFTVSLTDSNGKKVLKTINVDVTKTNDAPSFSTMFSDMSINEDNGTTNYELNVTDIEGTDLNITIESNNTSILTVTPNWSGLLTQGEYDGKVLDFNLSTVQDANGMVKITLNVIDTLNAITSKSFDINVTAVNDAPTFSKIGNIIVYKNSPEKNITLVSNDIDTNSLNYTSNITDTSLINSISFTSNTMSIIPSNNMNGNTDINVSLSDGEYNVSKVFNYMILPLEDGEDVTHVGEIKVIEDNNGTTIDLVIDDTLSINTNQNDLNNSVSHQIVVGGIKTQASSDINGSTVEIIDNGVHTTYNNNNVKAEVKAEVTGKATHSLTTEGKTTQATSEIIGATTIIHKVNNKVQIKTSVMLNQDTNTTASVIAKEDGSAIHEVKGNGFDTIMTSNIKGTQTTIKDGGVETDVTTDDNQTAKVTTKEDGTNILELTNNEGKKIDILANGESFDADSNTTITQTEDGNLEVTIESPLTTNLEFSGE